MSATPHAGSAAWRRRARPLLGTLVEVAVDGADAGLVAERALQAAFAAIAEVQAGLSRFDPGSDVSRFQALAAGASLEVRPCTAEVLHAAQRLHAASGGAFDITLGQCPSGWHIEGLRLHKHAARVPLDCGGIAKGHAVDCAVQALQASGCQRGWVNAGGDLRVFGDTDLHLRLRDESSGGTRPFGTLGDGAFATSHFGPGSRSACAATALHAQARAHVSVAAPLCLWADALTKVVARSGDAAHPLLASFGALAWVHRGTSNAEVNPAARV